MKIFCNIKRSTIISIIALFALASGTAGFLFGRYYIDNKRAGFQEKYVLYVYPDMSAEAIVDSISNGAKALSHKSLERCAKKEELHRRIKPGKYVIEPSHQSIYAIRLICNGWQTPQNMTLSGTIRTKGSIAQKISRQMMVDSTSVMNALNDSSFLAGYGFTTENVFALILPDTYQMYWTASVKDIFDRLKKEYDAFWTPERKELAKAQGLSQMEVSIMASIVSGETLKKEEYPVIAGVYLNRYNKKMRLQADPTIAFIHEYKLDRVLKKHLKVDSPYNTYKYVGLPPAPINSPSKQCIDAVLNPQKHKYIYFCASSEFDGTHKFAESYNQHLKNAREFQRALTAKRKAAAQKES